MWSVTDKRISEKKFSVRLVIDIIEVINNENSHSTARRRTGDIDIPTGKTGLRFFAILSKDRILRRGTIFIYIFFEKVAFSANRGRDRRRQLIKSRCNGESG